MHSRTLTHHRPTPRRRRDFADLAHYLPWAITAVLIAIGVAA